MLVLSRKVGQVIIVGDVRIMVTKVQGNRATIGVDAPKHMKITRSELVIDETMVGSDCPVLDQSLPQTMGSLNV